MLSTNSDPDVPVRTVTRKPRQRPTQKPTQKPTRKGQAIYRAVQRTDAVTRGLVTTKRTNQEVSDAE